jgi:hypothetical protein
MASSRYLHEDSIGKFNSEVNASTIHGNDSITACAHAKYFNVCSARESLVDSEALQGFGQRRCGHGGMGPSSE